MTSKEITNIILDFAGAQERANNFIYYGDPVKGYSYIDGFRRCLETLGFKVDLTLRSGYFYKYRISNSAHTIEGEVLNRFSYNY